jgi:hypothetical protein
MSKRRASTDLSDQAVAKRPRTSEVDVDVVEESQHHHTLAPTTTAASSTSRQANASQLDANVLDDSSSDDEYDQQVSWVVLELPEYDSAANFLQTVACYSIAVCVHNLIIVSRSHTNYLHLLWLIQASSNQTGRSNLDPNAKARQQRLSW